MPRKLREELITPEIPNHLILRGNNCRRLFSYPRDYHNFLRLLASANQLTGCSTHALCLMTNHVHDLATPPSVEATSNCIKHCAQRYAQIRNETRAATGKLFEQRFRSKPIASDTHMMAATMYIEANPVRAGLVKKAIDYPWSTYGFHAGAPERSEIPRRLWSPSDWYLSLGESMRTRAKAYRELFEDYLARPTPDEDAWVALSYLDEPYRRRLLRPNGSRAAEPVGRGRKRAAR